MSPLAVRVHVPCLAPVAFVGRWGQILLTLHGCWLLVYFCPFVCQFQAELTHQQNEFKIKLKELEDSLLSRLSYAGGNFLGDTALVENLETTKKTAKEIEEKVITFFFVFFFFSISFLSLSLSAIFVFVCVCGSIYVFVTIPQVAEANVTEKKINEAREHYRPAAARASLLYFILNDLNKINPLYQFSLKVREGQ